MESGREARWLVALASTGMTDDEIAARASVDAAAVANDLRRACQSAGVSTRAELILRALLSLDPTGEEGQ